MKDYHLNPPPFPFRLWLWRVKLLLLPMMLTALTFLACKTTENRPVNIPKGFDWQGHRGCRGLMPENSLPGFLKALEFPEVVTLELDLVVSKDGTLIVSHEPWFNPEICLLPDGDTIKQKDLERFQIYNMSTNAIQGMDCGSKVNPKFPEQQKIKTHKPTLSEVVEAVKLVRPNIRWNLEIKSQPGWDDIRHPRVEAFVQLVVAEIRKFGLEKLCTVQSFDVRVLNELHRYAPDLQMAFLIGNDDGLEPNMARLNFEPAIYSPYYLLVDKKLVKECHARKMNIIPWTVNDVKSMRLLIRMGVDGIITDYPNMIREVGKKIKA
ncbi:MAG: glycerophosphodiester phosphodiesterase family protein [Saprospiraceae bacterium]|nr:glycerophosphodiester phosphodiesterase family protein [Saprospiraceae bacterium]